VGTKYPEYPSHTPGSGTEKFCGLEDQGIVLDEWRIRDELQERIRSDTGIAIPERLATKRVDRIKQDRIFKIESIKENKIAVALGFHELSAGAPNTDDIVQDRL